jgi:hypothetical protein
MLYKDKRTYPRIYGLGNKPLGLWLRARLALQKFNTKVWYHTLSLLAQDDVTFLNYGYATTDSGGATLELEAVDEANRYPIQLYNRVASAVDLAREGRSGSRQRAWGRSRIHPEIPASPLYDRRRFLRQSGEVLPPPPRPRESFRSFRATQRTFPFRRSSSTRSSIWNLATATPPWPVSWHRRRECSVIGGHLLFADVGPKPYIDTLRGHIARCGLSIEEEEDITPAVSCKRSGSPANRTARRSRNRCPSGYARSSATLPAFGTHRCLKPAAQENGCMSALCSRSHNQAQTFPAI